MLSYVIKRSGLALLIVVTAVTLLYSMIHMIPGDPASIMLGPRATPELKEALRAKMGLDQPLPIQILSFFADIVRGDLGTDVFSNRPVADLVFEQLPHTLMLILAAIAWSAALGVPLGCYSALHPNTVTDKVTGIISVGCISIPSFLVALYALLIFAVGLKWFPAIGAGEAGDLGSRLKHLVLPALAVGLGWVGYIARLVRASMLEVMGESHIRTARAFGLPERVIVFRYALRLAILPTITVLGIGIGFLLSAAVFIEVVFARPGIGKLIIDSITTRNYPVVMGSVLVSTVLFVISTTLSDLINALLDPRIRSSL